MTLDFQHDPDTIGLALFYNAPLVDSKFDCALGAHRITLIIGTLVFGVEWRTQ